MLNDMILSCQRKALAQGLKALDEDEKLLLFTRPYVRRGIGPEIIREKPQPKCQLSIYKPCIALGADWQEPGIENDESFRWPSKK